MWPWPPLPHAGEHGLDHRDRAEHVGGELPLQVVYRGLLKGALVAVAGVVHQHVDWPGFLLRRPHRLGDRRIVRDIEQKWQRTFRRAECLRVVGAANRADHAVAGGESGRRKRAAKPELTPVMRKVFDRGIGTSRRGLARTYIMI